MDDELIKFFSEPAADGNAPLDIFRRELKQAAEEYDAQPGERAYGRVLALLLYGYAHGVSIPVHIRKQEEDGETRYLPILFENSRGEQWLPIASEWMEDTWECPVDMLFRVLPDEQITGAMLDPEGIQLKIPSEFFSRAVELYDSAYDEGVSNSEDEEEPSEPDTEPDRGGCSFSADCFRPMTATQFLGVEAMLLSLRDRPYEHLTVSFRNLLPGDQVSFIQTVRSEDGEGYHVELGFDMSDFDWTVPLILAGDGISPEDTLALFRAVCVDCTPTDELELVQTRFQDIGFGRDKAEE